MPKEETVNHPKHYNMHPSGIECIDLIEDFTFNFGCALKYLWRAGLKTGVDSGEDLRKARFYLDREINKRTKAWNQFAFSKNFYHAECKGLFDKDIVHMCMKVIGSDPGSVLSAVLTAYIRDDNPLEAFDNWTKNRPAIGER
jgi:hypothetical protein